MEARYERNIPSLSPEEQELLAHKRVLIVGCGGLGGNIIENLARMGVGELTVADGDVFEESNLNRQVLSAPEMLGRSKVRAASERIRWIDPKIRVHAVDAFFSETNADELVSGQDLVIDALDNVASRLLLEDTCAKHGVMLVHGAIQGWSAQASVIKPGSGILHRLYGSEGTYPGKTSTSFTPAFCAAIESAEAIRLLCGHASPLEGKVLLVDLREMHFDILDL